MLFTHKYFFFNKDFKHNAAKSFLRRFNLADQKNLIAVFSCIVKKAWMIILLLLCQTMFLWSNNNQKIIDQKEKVCTYLKALYLEQGLAPPFPSYPWSEEEIRYYLERIDPAELSKTGNKIYNDLLAALKTEFDFIEHDEKADSFLFFNTGLNLNLESYIHLPVIIPPDFESSDYVWTHGYEARLPMLKLPLEVWAGDYLYAASILQAREENGAVNNPAVPEITENYWNWFDFSNPCLEPAIPVEAYISAGSRHWNIQWGRDQLSWGNGLSGNLILSDYADFYDFIRFSGFWHKLKFTSVYSVMDSWLPDGSSQDYQAFTGHRLDLNLFNRINLAITEASLTDILATNLVKELNPVTLYHSWVDANHNSIAAAEISVNPWKYINLYGQLAFDEMFNPPETWHTVNGYGNWGWLIGSEAYLPINKQYLSLKLEYVKTDPWFYHREFGPYLYYVRRYWSMVSDEYAWIIKPLGYRRGADMQTIWFQAAYTPIPYLHVVLDLEYLNQGEVSPTDSYAPAAGESTPTGIPEQALTIHTRLENSTFSFFTTGIDLYWITHWNAGHAVGARQSDFEFIWYFRYTLY